MSTRPRDGYVPPMPLRAPSDSAAAAEAEPTSQRLSFKDRIASAEVHLCYLGVPVSINLVSPSVLDVERLVSAMVTRKDWSAPAQPGQATK